MSHVHHSPDLNLENYNIRLEMWQGVLLLFIIYNPIVHSVHNIKNVNSRRTLLVSMCNTMASNDITDVDYVLYKKPTGLD